MSFEPGFRSASASPGADVSTTGGKGCGASSYSAAGAGADDDAPSASISISMGARTLCTTADEVPSVFRPEWSKADVASPGSSGTGTSTGTNGSPLVFTFQPDSESSSVDWIEQLPADLLQHLVALFPTGRYVKNYRS